MTIKNQDKNISAEREGVVTDIQQTPYGFLQITFTNLHDEVVNEVVEIDLSGHKLKLVKLDSRDDLDDLREAEDEETQNLRASCIYLIPKEGINDEGIYEEYLWIEDDEDFENIGSTAIDLEPYFEKENIVTSWSNQTSDTKIPSEKLVKDSLNEKISKVSSPFGFVKSNGTIDENTYVTQQNFLEELGYYYPKVDCDEKFIQKSDTNGLVTNTGDIDTNTYVTEETLDDSLEDYYTKTESDNRYLREHQSLTNYYTKAQTDNQISNAIEAIDFPETDLSNYYTKSDTNTQISNAINEIDIPSVIDNVQDGNSNAVTSNAVYDAIHSIPSTDLSNYYTKTETDDQISNAINNIDIPEVDLNNYCTKTQISGFVLEVLTALDDELRG